MKQPLVNLRGSIRCKIRDSKRKSLMKGKQDYSARSSINGLVDFCRFLTAQDSKTDLTLIDQARQDLQQKIDHEVKMHDGCAKLLAASRRQTQKLEAAKNLITSNSRIQACMSEMQLLKARAERKTRQPEKKACSGLISVSDIRIPLIWKDSDKDHRKYSAFCLFQIGTDIQATTMIYDIHKFDTDICINDIISFNDANPDFELEVEVYCHKQESDVSLNKTPKKIKQHFNEISNTIGRSVGRRLSGIGSASRGFSAEAEDPEMVLGPKFELIARGCLRLEDVATGVSSHDLRVEETTTHEVSLYGHFCCRLSALPQCVTQEVHTAMLWMKTRKAQEWTRYWCTLKDQTLSGWKGRAEADILPAVVVIPIHRNAHINLAEKSDDGLSQFHIYGSSGRVKYVCAHENDDELVGWYEGLQQLIFNQSKWQQACSKNLSKGSRRTRSNSKLVSMFKEEQSFSVDSPMTRMLNRLNVSN